MMKKVLAISLVLCGLFAFTGCGENNNTTKTSKYDDTMKEYATNYYNSFQKGTEGLTETNITVGRLKEAVNLGIASYDMSKLAACSDESYVVLKINQTNNDVDSVEYHMECGK